MAFPVRLVTSAKTDVDDIYGWLLARSAKGAFNWYSALSTRLKKLSDDASGCAVAREAHRLNRDLRETYFKTRYGNRYRLIFTIVDPKFASCACEHSVKSCSARKKCPAMNSSP